MFFFGEALSVCRCLFVDACLSILAHHQLNSADPTQTMPAAGAGVVHNSSGDQGECRGGRHQGRAAQATTTGADVFMYIILDNMYVCASHLTHEHTYMFNNNNNNNNTIIIM